MRKRDAVALSRRLAAATREIEAVRDVFDEATRESRRETPADEIAEKITSALDALESADALIGQHYGPATP